MSEITEKRAEALASNILECHDVKPSEVKALAVLALLALRKEREAAEPVAYADPQAFRNFQASTANKEWMWAKADAGLVPVFVEAPPAQPVAVPDEMLCDFYEVSNWPDLVRELVKHVEQLQEAAKRNVKPWEDTFPETLLPAYIDKVKQADEACRAAMLAAPAKPSSLREGINALRELGGIDAEKIIAERDALNECEIPEGWKLVPIEPTQEMCDAVLGRACFTFNGDGAKKIYEAMLAAAPGKN
ncbi:hypothetical protein FZI02_08170 [Cronobacter sakazakii]|nr:hypothetical protein [Cronobacter sakazakii]EGT5766556.1 hypothetical protein [Cronobacter sakazakii]EJG0743113.1 hypothetical protein [Cronobacter sakazakii]EJG0748002.1 hypothetical protein [Cronobacter sakazakii]KAB0840562.1 hypothetical protein FZI02_08170 [Cronobacter sakazakii]